jgi:hypothetical protein
MNSIRIGVALFAVTCAAAPAFAQKKSSGSLAAIQLECFKAQGGYYDAAKKRWWMEGSDSEMLSRGDAVNKCVAEKTGKPAGQFMKQETFYK